jgi:hypothetical protein
MKRNLFFVALIIFSNLTLFAFEYKAALLDKNFKKTKYAFAITKVVDGRLNKQKSIGFIVERIHQQLETMWVGHDSLGESMTAFFKTKPEMFDTSLKIILVINQCNLRHIYGYSNLNGKYNILEIKIAFDYYKLNGNKYELMYQQYFIHNEDLKLVRNATKAVNVSFSETVKLALLDFNKQIALKIPLTGEGFAADSFTSFLHNTHPQEVTNQNIKDGLYFSCKDLYLNKPGTFKNFTIDTLVIGKEPSPIKAKNCIIEKAYAIVRQKRIFILVGNDFYKEALLSDEGILYFLDVTRTSLSKSARENSNAVAMAGSILPLGLLGALISGIAQSAIRNAGTTQTKTDIIVDFETGDLTYKN